MTLGEIIKEYREKNNMSQDALAEQSDISKAYISILERNKDPKTGLPPRPSIKTINVLAEAMGITFDELFSRFDEDFMVSLSDQIPKREPLAPSQPTALSPKAHLIALAYQDADPPIKKVVDTALEPYMPSDTEFAAELAPVIEFPKTVLPHYLQASTAGLGNYLDDEYYEMREFENAPKSANIAVTVSGDSMAPKYNPNDIVFVETDSVLDDGEIGIFCYDGQSYIKQLRLDPPRLVSLNKAYPDLILNEDGCRTIGRVLGK